MRKVELDHKQQCALDKGRNNARFRLRSGYQPNNSKRKQKITTTDRNSQRFPTRKV